MKTKENLLPGQKYIRMSFSDIASEIEKRIA